MKLERRFDWADRTKTYRRVDEDTVEKAPRGLVRFHAIDVESGNVYVGAGYETSVAQMCDLDFWKLCGNPKDDTKSIVVKANPPTIRSKKHSEKASSNVDNSEHQKAKGD